MAKKRRAMPSESDGSEDTQFVVEVIKAARVKDGDWEYLVKWANYDSADDSWEPEDNLDCPRLFDSFWSDVGVDDKDYTEGYVVKATPTWIKKEKKYFAKMNRRHVESSSDEEDQAPEASTSQTKVEAAASKGKGKAVAKQRPAKKRGRPPKVKTKPNLHSDDAGDSDNVPLSAVRPKGKKRVKKAIPSSDEADEDDQPLTRRPTITIPPRKPPEPAHNEPDPDLSDSAGSLFSEKGPSSPDVALGALATQPATGSSTIPMKRSSIDDSQSGQRKRQIMEMPMQITGTAGNATKARLAQRVPQAPAPTLPRLPARTTDLAKLSFKKTVATTALSPTQANSPVIPSPTIPQLPRRSGSTSDHGQSPAPTGNTSVVLEPHSSLVMGPPPPLAEIRRIPMLPRRTLTGPMPASVPEPLAEANRFLSEIMPSSMASPMQEDVMLPPPVPVRPAQIKASTLPRIQKKWKWTGEVFMDVSRNKSELVCEVTLTGATEPLPNGLRFSICLTGDSIRFSAFYDLRLLSACLLASTRASQFAKVGPSADKDADAVKQLSIYMKKRSLFCFAHLYMDETPVALLVLYPTGHEVAEKFLKVSAALERDCVLQVALVPWELTTKEFRAANWRSRVPTVERTLDPPFSASLDAAGRQVTVERRFYQALHILGFPKLLYDFLSQASNSRPYCIWNGPSDNTPSGPGLETSWLRAVLSTCKLAKDVGLKADVRIVFVHVGALATFYGLPALAERRAKQPDIRFFTYGTHCSVPRDRWGMREIYPIGGVVTLTPSAIIEGHLGVFKRIQDIADHPTWECYVLPSVVAMVAKLTCQGLHPLRVYDEGNFIYADLLKAIEQGSLALLHAPEIVRDPPPKGDPALLWTRWMLRLPRMDARQILEECLRLAAEQFGNASEADLPLAIEKQIARDIQRMQSQPAIMDNYRRFVILKGQGDKDLPDFHRGFECTTLSKFDFKDDYFNDPTKR